MKKIPFVTKQQIEEIVKTYPTPFHIYDEKGIRQNAKAVKDAFAWNKGFREYFAVKATPNPYILKILQDYDMGCDCSSYTELMLAKSCGFDGEHIMFSANETPAEEFAYANELGAIINLDDFTHIDYLEKTIGYIPETISCRYNPGGWAVRGGRDRPAPPAGCARRVLCGRWPRWRHARCGRCTAHHPR